MSYYEAIRDRCCPECGVSHGLEAQERQRLPKIDHGNRWDFIAPCGHVVMSIRKGSPLAKSYGLLGEPALREPPLGDFVGIALGEPDGADGKRRDEAARLKEAKQ